LAKPYYIALSKTITKRNHPEIICYQNKYTKLMFQMCGILTRQGMVKAVGEMSQFTNAMGIVGMLLGFYASVIMVRWWTQITKIPNWEDMTLSLNGLILPGNLKVSIY
jgi:hypothetical protein